VVFPSQTLSSHYVTYTNIVRLQTVLMMGLQMISFGLPSVEGLRGCLSMIELGFRAFSQREEREDIHCSLSLEEVCYSRTCERYNPRD
jgi:hypothetical protein